MAEANIAGTFYVCTIAAGPDNAQMYTVRFSNGAEQQVHSTLLRTTPPAGAPAYPPVGVVAQPVVATASVAVANAGYPTTTTEKAPLQETPAVTAQYPTPAAQYPTPTAAAAYPTPTATGIYPAIPPPTLPSAVIAAPAPVIVVQTPAPVVVANAPAVAVSTTTTASTTPTGPPFAVNEDVEALFRGNWFASKIVKSFGNGKYKVKYLKSKTFGTVTENKIRRKQGVVRKTVVTRTTTATNVAAEINKDVSKTQKEVNALADAAHDDITKGLNSVGKGIDCFLFGSKKKKATKTVTKKTVTKAAPPPTKQTYKVVTSTTTKIVNGKKVVTKTTKKIPIGAAPPTQQRFNVVVPAGCVAGQVITIAAPNGKQASVAIPAGLSAGQTFQVTMS